MTDASENVPQNVGRRFLVAGLAGGGGTFAALALTERLFRFADRAVASAGDTPPAEVAVRLDRLAALQAAAGVVGATALAGAVFGAVFFLAGGRAAVLRLIGSVACAAALAAAGGCGGFAAFRALPVGDQNLIVAAAVHGIVWGTLGAGAGLAARFALRRPAVRARCVTGGAFGGLVWGLLYPAIVLLVSPWAYAERPRPEGLAAQLVWSIGGGLALGTTLALASRPGRPVRRPAESNALPTPPIKP